MASEPIKLLVDNRKARHDFVLGERFEAGLALRGSEVKSLRAGNANLREAFVNLRRDGAWLMNCHISPYTEANVLNHEPTRPRQLLLHHHELKKLRKAIGEKGMTLVATRLYLKGSRVKVEVAVAKGKKLHDKRETLKARTAQREIDRGGRG